MKTLTDDELLTITGGARVRSRMTSTRDAVYQAMTQLQSTISSLSNQQPRNDLLLATVAMAMLR